MSAKVRVCDNPRCDLHRELIPLSMRDDPVVRAEGKIDFDAGTITTRDVKRFLYRYPGDPWRTNYFLCETCHEKQQQDGSVLPDD